MDQKAKFSEVLKKYTMIIALAVIVILFTVNTGGKMLLPQNVNNLIAQNAYVFILATGMLFCILTGGNIDLSVGSVVCFVGAVGGKMMIESGISPYLTILAMVVIGALVGAWQGFWIAYVRIPPVHRHTGGHADVPRTLQRGAAGYDAGSCSRKIPGAVQQLRAGLLRYGRF